MSRPGSPTVLGPDSVLVLAEPDYCYGRGTLTMRVSRIGADPRSFPKLEWVRVIGTEIRWTGDDGDRRDVMVRVAAIRESLRPPGWRPDPRHD